MCVRAFMRARARVCVCVCVRACICVCLCVLVLVYIGTVIGTHTSKVPVLFTLCFFWMQTDLATGLKLEETCYSQVSC